MKPIRRELLNGVFVLVVGSLISTAVAAFQVNFNVQLWVLIVLSVAVAVSGYVVFEFILSADERERAYAESTRQREEEWLKRVGNPARLELGVGAGAAGTAMLIEAVKAMKPGSDLTMMLHVSLEGGSFASPGPFFGAVMEQLNRGTIREYKRLLCFDPDVLVNDHDLKSGILRVGEGLGTISRVLGEHCRLMLATKGCSVYVAPVVLRSFIVGLYGTDKVSMTVDTMDQDTGARAVTGVLFFSDPPNGEIVEQFRQIERATERRMVAVHKIVFPEDAVSTTAATTG